MTLPREEQEPDDFQRTTSFRLMSKQTALILARWVVALTLIAKGVLILSRMAGAEGGDTLGTAAYSLFSFAAIIAGVLLAVPELVPWASAPVWRFLTGIVFPDDKFDRPPVNYALPRGYRERRRPDDAIQEYLKIVHYHPQELPAYLECMEVMIEAGDISGAENVRATGLRKLRSAKARRELKEKLDSLIESSHPPEH